MDLEISRARQGGLGSGTEIGLDREIFIPHSLGIFYQAMIRYLGFPHYGDEYKVVALAPYAQPAFMTEMRRLVQIHEDGMVRLELKFFRHYQEKIEYEWKSGSRITSYESA